MKKILFLILLVLSVLPVTANAAGKDAVKIAVASNGKDAVASISNKAGKCPYYLIFDGTGKLIEAVGNPYKDVKKGAGSQTADFLADKGITVVIAETFGEKMIEAIRSNSTDYFQLKGTALDAVKAVLNPGNQILMKLDRNLNPQSYESYRKLINIEPSGKKREFVLLTVKKGADKVAALFLSPASEKGRSTLRLDENMWLYIPNVGKPIRITSLQSVVGGVFNNSDILRLDYASEYFVEKMEEPKDKEELSDKYILHLKAKTKTVAYDKLKMWVDKKTILPTKIECLTEASMLIKTIYFKQTKEFDDKIVRPSVIETDSPLYKGYKSVMIYAKIKKRTFQDEIFTLTFMPNLGSLRQ
ncbi:MAG: outer membrane lipoprotein-sorting protein [Candidatus Scalindua sp.]|nr:outer membrane lipoprotein-sorting protein [Candidatus Scalindua sp.]